MIYSFDKGLRIVDYDSPENEVFLDAFFFLCTFRKALRQKSIVYFVWTNVFAIYFIKQNKFCVVLFDYLKFIL